MLPVGWLPPMLQPDIGLYPGLGPSVAEETREYQPPEASLGGLPYAADDPRSYDLRPTSSQMGACPG